MRGWNVMGDPLPPEGEPVLVTDGTQCAVLWYLMSSEYVWMNNYDPDEFDTDDIPIPFTPTHWKFLPPLP